MFIKKIIKQVYTAAFLAITIAGISSCKTTNHATTYVQIINASPDAGAVNLYLSGNLKTTTPITYGNSSGYVSTIVGNQTAEIKSASSANILVSTPVNLTENSNYSVYLSGSAASASLSSIVVLDDLSAPSAGKAKVRFVNTVSNSQQVSLIFNAAETIFSGVSYKSVTNFMEVAPGTYALTAVATAATAVNLASINQSFVSGKIYTIYLKGAIGATTNAQKLALGINVNK